MSELKYNILNGTQLKSQNIDILANNIYQNFIYLSKVPELQHNVPEIKKTLLNKDSYLILAMEDKNIAGYALATIQTLNDTRKVIYIGYIYVSTKLRERSIGSSLLAYVEQIAKQNECDGVLLTADTQKGELIGFYEKRGYMLDLYLRRFQRHDVFYKNL